MRGGISKRWLLCRFVLRVHPCLPRSDSVTSCFGRGQGNMVFCRLTFLEVYPCTVAIFGPPVVGPAIAPVSAPLALAPASDPRACGSENARASATFDESESGDRSREGEKRGHILVVDRGDCTFERKVGLLHDAGMGLQSPAFNGAMWSSFLLPVRPARCPLAAPLRSNRYQQMTPLYLNRTSVNTYRHSIFPPSHALSRPAKVHLRRRCYATKLTSIFSCSMGAA